MTREGVGVTGCATPNVGVSRGEYNPIGVGPVIVKAFPDAARAFCYVSLGTAQLVHFEVFVGAVSKQLRAARSEVGEPGDVLLGCEGSCVVKIDCGHTFLLSVRSVDYAMAHGWLQAKAACPALLPVVRGHALSRPGYYSEVMTVKSNARGFL